MTTGPNQLVPKKGPRKGIASLQEVERSFGSLEELAHFVMVERPELLGADYGAIAQASGLSVSVVEWLFRSSREFQALLDWFVAGEAWSMEERRWAYTELARDARDSEFKLGDRVKAMEYLDKKAGVGAREKADAGGVQIAVQVVQEGDGSWSEDYTPLSFGGVARHKAGSGGVGAGRVLEVGESGSGSVGEEGVQEVGDQEGADEGEGSEAVRGDGEVN